MSRTNIFCNVCGGPLEHYGLRGTTSVPLGEETTLDLYDDECTCTPAHLGPFMTPGRFIYGEPRHYKCAIWQGYDGIILPERRIFDVRMLCIESESLQKEDDERVSASAYFVTNVGIFDREDGILNRDIREHAGFPMHDACWRILQLVQETVISSHRGIDLRELFVTWKRHFDVLCFGTLRWSDRAYAVAEKHHSTDNWEPVKGEEWLAADPFEKMDFSSLITECLGTEEAGIDGLFSPIPGYSDPFDCLPTELRYMILEYLPTASVFKLSIVSPAFKIVAFRLLPAFWES
ncbi:uncharacterized protein ATNIH1004_010105 [Aspergillus tanneri]|uniref:F-box domain-containing protein n=1 Tax=Aspergillus tanneri TaxID=1220188 RepID=A0A5M9M911_9EURO|nr:uncharacterized protein ATNIH1004_010105 [Aspergillus tanneri]KAA8643338.1 hypothetical protein ATNIH1004_010105 [Aspergillus tanneri]